jgi:hypothetical protein
MRRHSQSGPAGRGKIHEIVSVLYDKHIATVEQIGGISSEEFARLNLSLVRLERFWTDQIRYRLSRKNRDAKLKIMPIMPDLASGIRNL